MLNKKLYKRLRYEMTMQDLSQADLARALGVSPYYVTCCINGKNGGWTLRQAHTILKLLRTDSDEALQLSDLFPTDDVLGGVRRGA